jgi:hypothetical protein
VGTDERHLDEAFDQEESDGQGHQDSWQQRRLE